MRRESRGRKDPMLDSQGLECYSCLAHAGVRRISPAPPIYEGPFWHVEHAYPCALKGWLVFVLNRHAEALHELSAAEFAELAAVQARLAPLLRATLDCEKEYLFCLAEGPHFHHLHVHLVPKPRDLPPELLATQIFGLLKVDAAAAVPPAEIIAFCGRLRQELAAGPAHVPA